MARQSLIGFRMVAFAMVMSAGQMILDADLARANDRGAEKDVAIGLVIIECIILIANRIIFFADPKFQGCWIQKEAPQIRKEFLVVSRSLWDYPGAGIKCDAARK